MIVYRNIEEVVETSTLLDHITHQFDELLHRTRISHDEIVSLLIDIAEFECAVVDTLCPERDCVLPVARKLRVLTLAAAGALYRSWTGVGDPRQPLAKSAEMLSQLAVARLPSRVPIRVSEGFAYYGLFPETYVEAATRFRMEERPTSVMCLGVRSIGTALSAVVAATLEQQGCSMLSHTVRPRGHPFARRLVLDAELLAAIVSPACSHFLVADEGPGLSGSSLTCVASTLVQAGVQPERIVFFPSWVPDTHVLCNEEARRVWASHRKYTIPFEETVLRPGHGLEAVTREDQDIAAGRWRDLFYPEGRNRPAVQPQHERRKYLRRTDGTPTLIKFAGLGRYGTPVLRRAEALAAAGFGPPPGKLLNGFIAYPFVEGRPVQAGDTGEDFIPSAARYCARLRRHFPGDRNVPFDEDLEMLRVNACEALGKDWERAAGKLQSQRQAIGRAPTTAIDGRMLPHEWLRARASYIKTDGTDHCRDHFFPGCQDIAWDLAGLCIEFRLPPAERERLIVEYSAHSGEDRTISRRLPFYLAAYSAYRLGYASLALLTISGEDALRFERLRSYYAGCLRAELSRHMR